MTLRTPRLMLAIAAGAMLARAADDAAAAGAPAADAPAAPSPIAEWEFPHIEGKLSFDCTTVPADLRLTFLKDALHGYVQNRLNAARSRHVKDETVAAWVAFDAASKADPLQSTVPQPTAPRPAEPNYKEVYDRAVADLQAGTVRKQSDTPKKRQAKDPLTSLVTEVVVRAVFDSNRAADPKYSFLTAKAAVGGDGLAYLNAAIEAKVAAAPEAEQANVRKELEKARDTKYVNPAKAMLGLTVDKKNEGLPSIL